MLKSIHLSENTKELSASSNGEEEGTEKIIMNTDGKVLAENEVDQLQQTDNEAEVEVGKSHNDVQI